MKQILMRIRLWAHRNLDWHFAVDVTGFDGCSVVGVCRVCDRQVLLDSQGSWFASSSQDRP